jgi:two-component system nitrogen regulation sensor histidine kinase NtrY
MANRINTIAGQHPREDGQRAAELPPPYKPLITQAERYKKKKLVRRVIGFCICLIPLFIWLQARLFNADVSLPVNSNIIIFALINLNVILIIIVVYLVLRNLAELLFERKLNILGSRLRTKLVVSFLSLSLIPAVLLFVIALQFISSSVEYWFNFRIEDSLNQSLQLARDQISHTREQAAIAGERVDTRLSELWPSRPDSRQLAATLADSLTLAPPGIPAALTLISTLDGTELMETTTDFQGVLVPDIPAATVQQVKNENSIKSLLQDSNRGELIRDVRKLSSQQTIAPPFILITTLLIEQDKLEKMAQISEGIESYRQLKLLKGPFKFWLLLVLLLVTLLIFFAAIWFGLRISRSITEPVDNLVAATRRISEGDFNFTMKPHSEDEIGQLITSFNAMTANINFSNQKLAEANQALAQSSLEAEQRRRHMEIILQNVSAGVISLDDHGRITTVNHFAEHLLGIERANFIGITYREAMPRSYALIFDRFIEELYISDKTSIERHLKVTLNRTNLSLLIKFTKLENDEGNPLGFVLVFDNLTKLEKMQRMAAWREVARRIAHEIKNPLTPIQLSAQRLRRRYPEILKANDEVFDRCTQTIITQVEEIRRLVTEFSQFARMPTLKKSVADLPALIRDTMVLYEEAHDGISFTFTQKNVVAPFMFDPEQIKRCLINLLDNGVAALPEGGEIAITLSASAVSRRVTITVADNGKGIDNHIKQKLFEPYFSTKKSGTGLGLAIVSTIVTDHNGTIRAEDNVPQGAIFIIELPMSEKIDDRRDDEPVEYL